MVPILPGLIHCTALICNPQVVRILKQYPMGRLVAFTYVLGVHLFIYLLIHRLQRRAFSAEHAAEVAGDTLGAMHSLHEQQQHEQLAG